MPAQLLPRRPLAALALVIATAWWPAGARGTTAIPSGQTGDILLGSPVTAIVGDVDGDGVRELVRLRSREENPAYLAVEVITIAGDGSLELHGGAPLDRGAGVEEQIEGGPQPDEENLLPARVDEPARLLAWHLDGQERVLAVAIGNIVARPPCCLTIWQVELAEGTTALRRLAGVGGGAEEIRAVDMDADGTDELVVVRAAEAISVLRWMGDGFEVMGSSLTPARTGPLMALGESDGLPGDEVGSIASSGTGAGTVLLHRIALDAAGRLRTERADLPFDGEIAAFAGPDGGRLVIGSDFEGAALLRWPAGAPTIELEARSLRRGVPVATLGGGEQARLLLLRNGGTLDVLSPDLRPNRLGVGGGVAAASFERTPTLPYVGLLPGGLPDGEAALIFRGRMVTRVPTGSERPRVEERTIASLPGITPIGVFGPDGARIALAVPTSLVRPAGFDATREGGQLVEPAGPARGISLVVARTQTVLSAELDEGLIELPTDGAVDEARPGARRTVMAGAPFLARLTAPVESRVLLLAGEALSEVRVDASGTVTLTVGAGIADAGDTTFAASVVVVTPSGHGYGAQWEVHLLTEPPLVEVTAPLAPLSFDVPLSGRTDPGARIMIDGTEVVVRPDGTFASAVQVGPLPRDVRIEAIDAVGNRASQTLSVVGFIDYRRLPWIPIVVVLTILVGALLYLRVPRPARPAVRVAGDDATFEEIE